MSDDQDHRLADAQPQSQPDDAGPVEDTMPDQPKSDNDSERIVRNINESADKIRLETQVKRGEGTRDEDRIKIKVRGDDPAETAQDLHETVVEVGQNGTVNALRGTQPTTGEDETDE